MGLGLLVTADKIGRPIFPVKAVQTVDGKAVLNRPLRHGHKLAWFGRGIHAPNGTAGAE